MPQSNSDLLQENKWLLSRVEQLEEQNRILKSELKLVTAVRDKLDENLRVFGVEKPDTRIVGNYNKK